MKKICGGEMKRFACRDIGMNCNFVAQDKDESKLMDKIAKHAREAHGMSQIDAQTMAKVKAAIKEV
jgi:predicted small metal-binding protein